MCSGREIHFEVRAAWAWLLSCGICLHPQPEPLPCAPPRPFHAHRPSQLLHSAPPNSTRPPSAHCTSPRSLHTSYRGSSVTSTPPAQQHGFQGEGPRGPLPALHQEDLEHLLLPAWRRAAAAVPLRGERGRRPDGQRRREAAPQGRGEFCHTWQVHVWMLQCRLAIGCPVPGACPPLRRCAVAVSGT